MRDWLLLGIVMAACGCGRPPDAASAGRKPDRPTSDPHVASGADAEAVLAQALDVA